MSAGPVVSRRHCFPWERSSSPLLRWSLHIARKGDAVVLLVVEHSTETYFLHRVVSFCINCCPLHKEMSLMRSESCAHYGYWDMNLEGSVIACLLSKRIVVDSPVRHMGSSIVGSWPDLQHQACISSCGKDPRSLWFSTSGIAVLTSSQILLPLQVCCPRLYGSNYFSVVPSLYHLQCAAVLGAKGSIREGAQSMAKERWLWSSQEAPAILRFCSECGLGTGKNILISCRWLHRGSNVALETMWGRLLVAVKFPDHHRWGILFRSWDASHGDEGSACFL